MNNRIFKILSFSGLSPLHPFIFLSASMLLIPIGYPQFKLVFLVASAVFAVPFLIKNLTDGSFNLPYHYLIFGYALVIGVATVLHGSALYSIQGSVPVTVLGQDSPWGMKFLSYAGPAYILFPIIVIIVISLLQHYPQTCLWFYLIPLIFVPSLMVALFQQFVDIGFLTPGYAVKSHRVAGLSYDFNGFGISCFFIIICCVIVLCTSRRPMARILFGVILALAAYCMALSGNRTGLIGITLATGIMPLVYVWARGKVEQHIRFLVIAYGVFLFAGGTFFFTITRSNVDYESLHLLKRIQDSYRGFTAHGVIGFDSSRLEMGAQGCRLARLSPLSGWGPGGFWRNVNNARFKYGEEKGLLDNALNHYLQIGAELGFIGLLFNVLIHAMPLWMVFKIRKNIRESGERLSVGIAYSTVVIMLLLFMTGPHTMSVDVLWILSVFLGFLFVTAIRRGYGFNNARRKYYVFGLAAMIVLFTFGAYGNTFGTSGYEARMKTDFWSPKGQWGYYPYEEINGERMRWTGCESLTHIVAQSDLAGVMLFSPREGIGSQPLACDVYINGVLMEHITFHGERKVPLYFYLPQAGRKIVELKTIVSSTFNPHRLGIGDDTRDLGVAVSPVQFLKIMPVEGIGFYRRETTMRDIPSGWPEGEMFRCRSTGMQATFNVASSLPHGGELYLECSHPDVTLKPVSVSVSADGREICRISCNDGKWKRIAIPPESVKNVIGLTVRVDRTWNPEQFGFPGDDRDIGVRAVVRAARNEKGI